MTPSANPIVGDIDAFAFEAQGTGGQALSGTINAGSVDDATRQLTNLQLRVIALDPVRPTARPRRLKGDSFAAFNMQLAHLTTAGLPVEKSLRLIADDMRSGRLAETVRQVATDLESGQSLPEAFEKHAAQFPTLYSQLVSAGIHTGNLAGMLLSLGRHLDLVTRLRGMIWKAIAYPIVVLISLLAVISFLGIYVFPQFRKMFSDFRVDLPAITQCVIVFSDFLVQDWPILLGTLIFVVVVLPLLWRFLLPPEGRQRVLELLVFPLPLIGAALRRNLLARWCDALKLGVEAGLDLPQAILLAGQAVGSPGLRRDGNVLIEAMQAGRPLDTTLRTRLIPPTVVTVLTLAGNNRDLPSGLDTLSLMFQQQAEMKLAMLPSVVTPALVMLIGCVIAFVLLAMFAPMISMVSAISGPVHHHH